MREMVPLPSMPSHHGLNWWQAEKSVTVGPRVLKALNLDRRTPTACLLSMKPRSRVRRAYRITICS